MAIIVLIMGLASPAIRTLVGAQNANQEFHQVASVLNQARAYAVSNSTYVLVGFAEVDASIPASATQQQLGTGRIILSTVASKDGTKIYDENTSDIGTDWLNKTKNGQGLAQIGKIVRLENLHMAAERIASDSQNLVMANTNAVDDTYRIGNNQCASVLQFAYPLSGSPISGSFNFTKVIQFDSQGSARVIRNDNYAALNPWIEIILVPTHGNKVTSSPNFAQLQVEAVTGNATVYRP